MNHQPYIEKYFTDAANVLNTLDRDKINHAIDVLFYAWRNGNPVYTFGNGGSASTASHFAGDLSKTINDRMDAPAIRAFCLSDNVVQVTATVNDRGWDTLYDQMLRTHYGPGGIGVAFSVHGGSGQDLGGKWSQNLLRGLQYIKDQGGYTIGFSGFDGGAMKDLCDLCIVVPAHSTAQVESFHVTLTHLIAFRLKEMIEYYTAQHQAHGQA